MFKNEVIVLKNDKKLLCEYLSKAKTILDKYPYSSDYAQHTVTTISRAKNFVDNAEQWTSYLYTDPNEELD